MCRPPPLPQQRRHRAAYVAPSADDLYPETASLGATDDGDTVASLIPLLVEVPSAAARHRQMPVTSPPSSADWLSDLEGPDDEAADAANATNTSSRMIIVLWKVRLIHSLKACYGWCVDIFVVVAMCVLGCFLYDVEVRMVKQQPSSSYNSSSNSNRRRYRERRRVMVVRKEDEDDEGAARRRRQQRPVTSLLRSPGNGGGNEVDHHHRHHRTHQPWGYV